MVGFVTEGMVFARLKLSNCACFDVPTEKEMGRWMVAVSGSGDDVLGCLRIGRFWTIQIWFGSEGVGRWLSQMVVCRLESYMMQTS